MIREIVEIDRERCDGCGACVPSCAEGALRVVNGKLELASDALCDGLGACLGHCPQGALRVVRREATAFDEAAVAGHVSAHPARSPARAEGLTSSEPVPEDAPSGCPGSRPRSLPGGGARSGAVSQPPAARGKLSVVSEASPGVTPRGGSRLEHWPVQLALVAPGAPDLRGADLLLAADCVPFAYAHFHDDLLAGRRLLVACPKLDDLAAHAAKLAELIRRARPRSVKVARMEVPCCGGLVAAARQAAAIAGHDGPFEVVTIGVAGDLLA